MILMGSPPTSPVAALTLAPGFRITSMCPVPPLFAVCMVLMNIRLHLIKCRAVLVALVPGLPSLVNSRRLLQLPNVAVTRP